MSGEERNDWDQNSVIHLTPLIYILKEVKKLLSWLFDLFMYPFNIYSGKFFVGFGFKSSKTKNYQTFTKDLSFEPYCYKMWQPCYYYIFTSISQKMLGYLHTHTHTQSHLIFNVILFCKPHFQPFLPSFLFLPTDCLMFSFFPNSYHF